MSEFKWRQLEGEMALVQIAQVSDIRADCFLCIYPASTVIQIAGAVRF
jgi:hypothetical protein